MSSASAFFLIGDLLLFQDQARSSEQLPILSDLRFMYKIYQECSAADLSSCLKLKLVAAMDRAARSFSDINLVDGVTFVKDQSKANEVEQSAKSEVELEASLPRSLNDRETTLNALIMEKVSNFFDSHSLQVTSQGRGIMDAFYDLASVVRGLLALGRIMDLFFGDADW